ncbi:MAG: AmmeMemoRadiSam system protein B [Syntrophobacteraceae bacterium]|nr:AmmeMemoRadiSam system protein B [Syntrophobacteraceae bacterium]
MEKLSRSLIPRAVGLAGKVIFLAILGTLLRVPEALPAKEAKSESQQIREPVFAGSWYPGSPSDLRREVEGYLERVPRSDDSARLLGLICPHAGYMFSGGVAAHAYRLLQAQKPATVILVAPSHHLRFSGVALYPGAGFRTPLGVLSVDRRTADCLKAQDSRIQPLSEAFAKEHSVEVQLPFLQVASPESHIVALVMGDQDLGTCQWLAKALTACIEKQPAVVIATSDLSHFHSYDQAKALDKVVQDKVAGMDPEGLSRCLSSNLCEACGGGAIITAMLVVERLGANRAQVLHYANSGDVIGDRNRVVGYMAAAFWADAGRRESKSPPPPSSSGSEAKPGLTLEDKAQLRKIAREMIEAHCRGKKAPEIRSASPRLEEPCGAFVTLKKHGELRGCIGRIISDRPLAETVAEMAVAAAARDPRFPPLTADELKDIEIEVSVLTPLRKITDPQEIQVGTHGIYIQRNGSAGLLLPQVAVEHGWDRQVFLEQTCNKAGLPRDAWKDPKTEIYVFAAEVF